MRKTFIILAVMSALALVLMIGCKPAPNQTCSTGSDCFLRYVGDAECAPCDYNEKDYKCVSKEAADAIDLKRGEILSRVQCMTCIGTDSLESTANYECACSDAVCGIQKKVGIANPASVYCEENGGTLEIVTAADGSQSGICTLKDGTKCDEWAYFRGECPAK